jgi:hypothetical protein
MLGGQGEQLMPLIKPRTERTTSVRHITHLYEENEEVLFAYAAMIGESTAYVLNGLIDTLKKDPDYKEWRPNHQNSFVPARGNAKSSGTRLSRRSNGAGRAAASAIAPAV